LGKIYSLESALSRICFYFYLQDIRKAVAMMKNIAVQLEKENQTDKVGYYFV